MRGGIQSLGSKGLLHPSACAFPKMLGWLLRCQHTSAQGAFMQSLLSSAKKTLAGEKTRRERSVHLSLCNYQELFLRRETPMEISLWLDLRTASVHTGVIERDFTSFDIYHKHPGLVICKSYQTLLILERVSGEVVRVYNYLCTEKSSNHKEMFNVGRAGKTKWQMKLDVKILPLPQD